MFLSGRCFCCPGQRTLKALALLTAYAGYLALGAAVFSAIESPIEARYVEILRTARKEFLERFPQVTGNSILQF
jgi:hypothetical protein